MTTITTPAELDALPVGSVVLDRHRDSWQKVDDTPRLDEDGSPLSSAWASIAWKQDRTAHEMFTGLPGAPSEYNRLGPLTLIHRPDAPAPAAENREALAEQMRDAIYPIDVPLPDPDEERRIVSAATDAALAVLASRQPAPTVSAEAVWDEGYGYGLSDAQRIDGHLTPNPHRKAARP